MRIIKQGKIPTPDYRGLCHRCGAEVEYARCESIGERWNGNTHAPIFYCPTEGCNAEIIGARLPDRNREAIAA